MATFGTSVNFTTENNIHDLCDYCSATYLTILGINIDKDKPAECRENVNVT